MKLFLRSFIKFSGTFVLLILTQLIFFSIIISSLGNFSLSKDKTTLILGDSCTETCLNDSIIGGCINLSQGADAMIFEFFKLKEIHKRNNQIKTVILGFSPDNAFSNILYDVPVTKSRYGNYFYLIDFYGQIDLIRHNPEGYLKGISGLGKYFVKAPIIIYKNDIRKIGLGGFDPRPMNISQLEESINSKEIDPALIDYLSLIEIKYFNKIAEYCSANDLHLIVMNPPVHSTLLDKRKDKKKIYHDLVTSDKYTLSFWDLEKCNYEDKYFYDNKHLNYDGSVIFSKMIDNKLKEN